MSTVTNHDSRLWGLLEKGKLADLSQFHEPGFFDELPLFSRRADVDFLVDTDESANGILLSFALRYLKSVVAFEEHRRGYFAAITIWTPIDETIVPNLFAWCGSVRELARRLSVTDRSTEAARKVKKLLPKHAQAGPFVVLTDTAAVDDMRRVFITFAKPPYEGFVNWRTFQESATDAR
jgi:hypothetical protein